MSVERTRSEVAPPCRPFLEKMAENMHEAEWWENEAVRHEGRGGECAMAEAAMCNDRAASYRRQAFLLGNFIFDGEYLFLDLPEAV